MRRSRLPGIKLLATVIVVEIVEVSLYCFVYKGLHFVIKLTLYRHMHIYSHALYLRDYRLASKMT